MGVLLLVVFLAGVAVLAILRWRNLGLFAGLVFAVLFIPFLRGAGVLGIDTVSVGLGGVTALGILATSAASWAVWAATRKLGFVLHCSPYLLLPIAAFVWLNLVAVALGILRYGPLAALTDADWLVWIGFFVLVLLQPSFSLFSKLAMITFGVSTVRALWGLFRLAHGMGWSVTTGGQRYLGSSDAQFIAAGFIVSLMLLLFVIRRRRTRSLILAISVLQLAGILISLSRQTWVALATSLCCGVFLFMKGKRLRFVVASGFMLGILVFGILVAFSLDLIPADLLLSLLGRFGGGDFRQILRDPSVQFRFAAWREAVRGIQESPLLGKGWGAPHEFSFVVLQSGKLQTFDVSPHNTYLWLAYKAGVPALLLFMLFIARLLVGAVQRYHRVARVDRVQAAFLIGTVLIQVTYSIGALWWDYFTVVFMSIPIWLNLGILAVLSSGSMDQDREDSGSCAVARSGATDEDCH